MPGDQLNGGMGGNPLIAATMKMSIRSATVSG